MNDEKDKAAALLDLKRGGDRLRDITKKHRDALTDREREILDTRFNTNDLNKRCDHFMTTDPLPNRGKNWNCTKPPGHEGPHSRRPCYTCGGPIEHWRPNCYNCEGCG